MTSATPMQTLAELMSSAEAQAAAEDVLAHLSHAAAADQAAASLLASAGGTSAPKSSLATKKRRTPTGASSAPAVGSPEWVEARRESHKQVERRRREAINAHIAILAGLLPPSAPSASKSSILLRAIDYIKELRESEARRVEEWVVEKGLADSAIREQQTVIQSLRDEVEAWKRKHEVLQGGAGDLGGDGARKRTRAGPK